MFFIFVLSHPQHIGDFFRYNCRMDVGVQMSLADMTMPSKEEAVFPPVYLCLYQRKNSHRCFQLTSTQVPLIRIGPQVHSLADKGYWVDTNSHWHRNARGSNSREEEKDMPQEKEQRQRQANKEVTVACVIWYIVHYLGLLYSYFYVLHHLILNICMKVVEQCHFR